jgi:hypothetical protein
METCATRSSTYLHLAPAVLFVVAVVVSKVDLRVVVDRAKELRKRRGRKGKDSLSIERRANVGTYLVQLCHSRHGQRSRR